MGGQTGETRSGIGARLRAGRERKGLTILQAAEKMHVDPKILESLESEDFTALGAPVYVRGHLKHYAELVGESPTELHDLYTNNTRTVQPDLTRIPKGEPPSDTRRLTVPAAMILGLFAIAGAVWWVLSVTKGHDDGAKSATITVAAAPAAPQDSLADEPIQSSPVPTDEGPAENVRGARTAGGGAGAVRGMAPSGGTGVGVNARVPAGSATPGGRLANAAVPTSATLNPRATPSTTVDAAPKAPRPAELTLKFSAESWAEVYDANGEKLFYDIGSADSVKSFKGVAPMRVVLGNAPGVLVQVNGHTADLANVTHPDGTAQFSVTRSGRASEAHQ